MRDQPGRLQLLWAGRIGGVQRQVLCRCFLELAQYPVSERCLFGTPDLGRLWVAGQPRGTSRSDLAVQYPAKIGNLGILAGDPRFHAGQSFVMLAAVSSRSKNVCFSSGLLMMDLRYLILEFSDDIHAVAWVLR
jgi:hypothetical protein